MKAQRPQHNMLHGLSFSFSFFRIIVLLLRDRLHLKCSCKICCLFSESSSVANMSASLFLLTCLLIILIKLVFKRPVRFPPGPPHIPIAGSLPFLFGIGVERYVSPKIASYGPVTGMYLGTYPSIMINDWKLAKKLFMMEEFCQAIIQD